MRFALSAEQEQFATSLDKLLSDADTPSVIRSWSSGEPGPGLALWRDLAEIGVLGLLVPEGFDGLGAGPVDLVVAFDRLGYHAVPGPLVESAAAVPVLLEQVAGERFLPQLSGGELVATLAMEPHVPFALDADVADLVLRVDESGVCESVREGGRMSSVDRSRRLFATTSGRALGAGPALRAFDFGALACAAQLHGAGRWLLDTATEHVKQREQYGRELARFQAVKHLLADVVTALELARPLLYGAALALEGAEDPAPDVSAAKVAAADAAYLAARTCLQLHGAVGYTAEHDVGLWLTKVRALLGVWGTQDHHRARVASGLGLRSPGSSA
jgi:alkylation response protein AidB-like acyl-CoA dehydrogenase